MARMPTTGYVSGRLDDFLKEFAAVGPRAIRQTILLILAAGCLMVWQMARRMLQGPRRLIHREKRLCRQLKSRPDEDVAMAVALREYAGRLVGRDSLVPLDCSDISKPYGRRMEHLGRVHDGSGKTSRPGYWLVAALVRGKRGQLAPMLMRCFSTVQPGIKSFNAVLVQSIDSISEILHDKGGILVCDRGFDAIRLLAPMLDRGLRFIVRLVGELRDRTGSRAVAASDTAAGAAGGGGDGVGDLAVRARPASASGADRRCGVALHPGDCLSVLPDRRRVAEPLDRRILAAATRWRRIWVNSCFICLTALSANLE